MIKIFGRRSSSNVMKPLWAADELGLDYEQIDRGGEFGGTRDPDYRALNPMGLVPTLVDDGFALWESNAMTRYLCEKYGDGSLHPSDRQVRATADTWMDWQQTICAPMMRPLFYALVRTAEAERDEDEVKARIERGRKVWGVLNRYLANRAFVAGDAFTMGDIAIGPHAHRWFNVVEKRPPMPNMEAWYQRLTERPAFRKNVMIPIE